MKLVFVTEARFIKDANGNFYGESSFNYGLWQRYLLAFSEVVVMARIKYDNNYSGDNAHLSSGSKVSFIELPYYIGPLQYLKKYKKLKNKIAKSLKDIDAVFICRIPGAIGTLVINYLNKKNKPYGVEVVGDPWDVMAPGSIKHVLRFYFRCACYLKLKKNLKKAAAAV